MKSQIFNLVGVLDNTLVELTTVNGKILKSERGQ